MTMDRTPMLRRVLSLVAASLALVATGCDGSNSKVDGETPVGGVSIVEMSFGRLVDVYAYRRVDRGTTTRLDVRNRRPVLVQRDVVVDPSVTTDLLIDAEGNEIPSANYRYLSFDEAAGHPELVILWDDTVDGERERFDAALEAATGALQPIVGGFRGQNTAARPFSVVPRDAAIRITFDGSVGFDSSFFNTNQGAVQLLQVEDDPTGGSSAFIALPVRVIVDGQSIIVDPTIQGDEALRSSLPPSVGLPPSFDTTTANIRLALPTDGDGTATPRFSTDRVPQFNSVALDGRPAVIRDFRSSQVGEVDAVLPDTVPPTIVATPTMGITDVDGDVLTINKRNQLLAVRGRIPFVLGGLDIETRLPLGGQGIPTLNANGNKLPLPLGDEIIQEVEDPITGQTFRLRAEVLEVLDVGTVLGEGPTLGRTVAGTDGGELEVIRVRVDRPVLLGLDGTPVLDSTGAPVGFRAGGVPPELGADCTVRVRYYEFVGYDPLIGAGEVSDAPRRELFFEVEQDQSVVGAPILNGSTVSNVESDATVRVRFSEPLDVAGLLPSDNVLLTNDQTQPSDIADALVNPKRLSLTLQGSELTELDGGTGFEIAPVFGFFHQSGAQEEYFLHLLLNGAGDRPIRDLAGNALDLFDQRSGQTPDLSFSIRLRIAGSASENLVASRVLRFESGDEDGSPDGAPDYFGQFQIGNGQLVAEATTRRRRTADQPTLETVDRFTRGECVQYISIGGEGVPVVGGSGPTPGNPGARPGFLYRDTQYIPQNLNPPRPFLNIGTFLFGGSTEPFEKRGSRMMIAYREDDFGLSHTDPSDLAIDVEQMHWASWNNVDIVFDRFARTTIGLAHSERRPELVYESFLTPPPLMAMPPLVGSRCSLNCKSLFSGLRTVFADNVLDTTTALEVVKDKPYEMSLARAFTAESGFLYHPYPEFDLSYTWRDWRLAGWDVNGQVATGMSGAADASGLPPDSDVTTSISSPWVTDDTRDPAPSAFGSNPPVLADETGTPGFDPALLPMPNFVRDRGDFLGDRTQDHNPIAAPLLMDIQIFPEANPAGQLSGSVNALQIAIAGDYYNIGFPPAMPPGVSTPGPTAGPFACTNIPFPGFRLHVTGGVEPTTGAIVEIDPSMAQDATGVTNIIKNMGLGDPVEGLVEVQSTDPHLPWAAVDLVRRVSVVTGGFFDTLQPHLNGVDGIDSVPNLSARTDLAAGDFRVVFDPPLGEQPVGTAVNVEFRGASDIPQANLWNPFSGTETDVRFDTRGNLLNPFFSCEAFRYASPNLGLKTGFDGPRLQVGGLTNYVPVDGIDQIRSSTGGLPRYLNFRISMENNIEVTPVARPFLRSMTVVYRLQPGQ